MLVKGGTDVIIFLIPANSYMFSQLFFWITMGSFSYAMLYMQRGILQWSYHISKWNKNLEFLSKIQFSFF